MNRLVAKAVPKTITIASLGPQRPRNNSIFVDVASQAVAEPQPTTEVTAMLGWAVTFLIIALIAALLGFGVIAGVAIEAAKIVFFVAIVLFAISVIAGLGRGRAVP